MRRWFNHDYWRRLSVGTHGAKMLTFESQSDESSSEHPAGGSAKVKCTAAQFSPLGPHRLSSAAAHQFAGSSTLSRVSRMRTSLQVTNMRR